MFWPVLIKTLQVESQRQYLAFCLELRQAAEFVLIGEGFEESRQLVIKGLEMIAGVKEQGLGGQGAGVVDERVVGTLLSRVRTVWRPGVTELVFVEIESGRYPGLWSM